MLNVLEQRRDNIQRLMDLITQIYGIFGFAGLMGSAEIDEERLILTETRGHLRLTWDLEADAFYDPAKTACTIELWFNTGEDETHSTVISLSTDNLVDAPWIGLVARDLHPGASDTRHEHVTEAQELIDQFEEFQDRDQSKSVFRLDRAFQLIQAMVNTFCGQSKIETEAQGIPFDKNSFQGLEAGDLVLDTQGIMWNAGSTSRRHEDRYHSNLLSVGGKLHEDIRWHDGLMYPLVLHENRWVRDPRFEGPNVRVIKKADSA